MKFRNVLFILKLLQQDLDSTFLLVMYSLSIGLSNLYLYCHFAKNATDYYEQFADCLYNSDWTNLPNEFKKPLVIMIGNAQIPLLYHGFNIANLDLELFSRVKFCSILI